MERSFNEHIRRMQENNWNLPTDKSGKRGGKGGDDSFKFDFDSIWEGAEQDELDEFNSLYRAHLETHYTAHEKAVREVGGAGVGDVWWGRRLGVTLSHVLCYGSRCTMLTSHCDCILCR
jgi:hypothetical protein